MHMLFEGMDDMKYRPLGRTGLKVSELALGTMTFAGTGNRFFEGVGGVDLADATRMLGLAMDAGINLIDTADVYSHGSAEEMLGEALTGRRDRFLIATKCHGRMAPGENDVGQSRHHMIASCDASLRRLRTDYIDLYQIHGYDALARWDECLGALTDLQRSGKVRLIGASNLTGSQLMKSLWVADRRHLSYFSSLQANYSLVAREAEYELLRVCAEEGLGFLAWSPLAGGFLSGKYRAGVDAVGRRGVVGDPGSIDPNHGSSVLAALEKVARACSVPTTAVAIRYLLGQPAVSSVILGARSVGQLEENLLAADLVLADEAMEALSAASDRPAPYPYWHQRTYNTDRAAP